MKRLLVLLTASIFGLLATAQDKMYIHKNDGFSLGAWVVSTDSVQFSSNGQLATFNLKDSVVSYSVSDLDSLTFGANSITVAINFDGTSVQVVNPLAFEGVDVSADGADVTINSTTETRDVIYHLTGVTTDGSFKIYTQKRINIELDGVEIKNADGPAINIQDSKKATVTLVDGTQSVLRDGSTYAEATLKSNGEYEDQKAVLFSEGQLIFNGGGSLAIAASGTEQHAICSDDYIEIDSGEIVIATAVKDGIHAKNGIFINDGVLDITSTGDCIDASNDEIEIAGGDITVRSSSDDVEGITSDSTILITGGSLDFIISGDKSKGLCAEDGISLQGGTLTFTMSGGVVTTASGSGYEVDYSSAIKCDSTITVDGADIEIAATGVAGRGISSDYLIDILSGTVDINLSGNGSSYTDTDGSKSAYVGVALVCDEDISIAGGEVELYCSGSGGKAIDADGAIQIGTETTLPVVEITTTGAEISLSTTTTSNTRPGRPGSFDDTSGDAAEAKAIRANGEVTILNGDITISSADDGIKSDVAVTISNADVSIIDSSEGIESPLITVNSGYVGIEAEDDGFNATNGDGGESDDGSMLNIYGGEIYLSCTAGDDLDSNGSITMTGGTVVAHGPASSPEVGLDVNGECLVSGGLLVVTGPYGNMTEAPSTSSEQYSVSVHSNSSISTTTLFHVQDASGATIFTLKPERSCTSVIFSAEELASGSTYYIYTGGSSTGTYKDGLYSGGSYSGGTLKKSFTISSKVTSVSF